MEKKKKYNYFIIERLDQNEESDCLSNIYDLSILNKIKEIKADKNNRINHYFKNIIKEKDSKKLNQDKKKQIIQVIKKVILSLNLTYKWKLITFKQILIFFHIFLFISSLTTNIRDKNRINSFINQKNMTNIDFNDFNIAFNINVTNKLEKTFYINNTYLDSRNIIKNIKKSFFLTIIINQIILIPVWLIFICKYIPKWGKINDILYKFTNYLLLCESNENKLYFYYLMKDYSIFITTKEYYYENKENLPIYPLKNEIIAKNNIFLYCINIINDFILEDFTTLSYYELISQDDYNDINILIKYIDKNIHEKLKKFNKKIMIPLIISILIALLHKKISLEYIIISLIILFLLLLISEFIFKEYIRKYKLDIDKFIDNLNNTLIKKNRFIYRKKKLIMFLALKNNSYTKNQIIKNIEKIINS